MVDVEVVGRLVEQQLLRVLGEGARDLDALALAAREGVPRAAGQLGQLDAVERRGDGRRGRRRRPTTSPRCGMRPSRTTSATVRSSSVCGVLLDDRDAPGDVAAPQRPRSAPSSSTVPASGAGRRRAAAAGTTCRSRWGRAARRSRPGRTSSVTPSTRSRPPTRPARRRASRGSCRGSVRRKRITANAGTPTSAVTTPTGSSCGSNTVRATRVDPHQEDRADQRGRRQQQPVPGPTRSRAACGSTSPTKPIAPAALTSVAVMQRGDDQQHQPHPAHRDAERRGGVLAERERVERGRVAEADDQPATATTAPHSATSLQPAPRERAEQPEQHAAGLLGIGRRGDDERGQRREQLGARDAGQHDPVGAAAGARRQQQHQPEGHERAR